ncbi:MAG: MYXO-CTERM sorting domain-containing protein [Kofleriaceae bacterium]
MNEVLLSHEGDATRQLVEIEDLGNEPFGAGYTLFVYEADGTSQAHFQNLVVNPGTMRITIASASAYTEFGLSTTVNPPFAVTNLNGTLPAAGTACFRKSGVDLHCMSWGLVTLPTQNPTNGRLGGPAPMDNMSLQRQATGNCAGIGAPTPNAVNTVLTCMDPPMGGGDAGPMNDGGMMGSDGGTMPPPSDDGCSAAGGGAGLGVILVGLLGLRRRRR